MEIKSLYKSVLGLDVHQSQITACALIEDQNGELTVIHKQFGAFKRDRQDLAQWAKSLSPDQVVMESTGIYWKSPYAALEAQGIKSLVVNARHVKKVPGRKTDIGDAQWLATLARAGLLNGSFIPSGQMRELRLISRQRQKLVGQLASEKNRMHKILTDGGIRLAVVVSDLHGKSAREMIKALIEDRPAHEVLNLASNRLKATRQELLDALSGELTDSHRFVLKEIMSHLEELEARIKRFEAQLLQALKNEHDTLTLLQTLPGVDLVGAAMLLVEIGDDMNAFRDSERLAAWVGICPGNNESAGKRKSSRVRKGNPYVRRLLCEFANAASRTRSGLANKFKAMVVRKGRKKAIVALAHKMLRIVFCMIKRRDYYRDSTVDYEAVMVQKNAPRWIKMLAKFGYINYST